MSTGDLATIAVGAVLVVLGSWVVTRQARGSRGLARYESQALLRSSLLNRERVERINASRESAGNHLIDRIRIALFGFWLVFSGVVAVVAALN